MFYLNTSTEGGDVNLYFDNSSAANFYNNILYNSSLPCYHIQAATVIAKDFLIFRRTGQPVWNWMHRFISSWQIRQEISISGFNPLRRNQRYSPCIGAILLYGDTNVIGVWE
jgi:hypothetical protein